MGRSSPSLVIMSLSAIKNLQRFFLFFFVFVMAMATSGCFAKVTEETKKKDLRDGAVDVFGDRTKCDFDGPPSGGSLNPLEGTWESLDWQQNEKLRFTYKLTFNNIPDSKHTIQFENHCTHKGTNRTASAKVMTSIVDHIRYFEVEKSLYAERTEKFPEFDITCDASSKAGRFQYNFDRDCLVIDGGYYIKSK